MPDATRKVDKIQIDKGACIGAATCGILAPQAFQLDKDGIASLLPTAMTHTDEELIQAAKSCPTQAIKLLDKDNNQI